KCWISRTKSRTLFRRLTKRTLSTATLSQRMSSLRQLGTPNYWTLELRKLFLLRVKHQPLLYQQNSRTAERLLEPSDTCPRSRRWEKKPTGEQTCFRLAQLCTRWRRECRL